MKATGYVVGFFTIFTGALLIAFLLLESRRLAKFRPHPKYGYPDICSGVNSKCIIVDEDFLKYIKASTKWKKFMEKHERDVFMGFGIYPKDAEEDSK